MCASAGETAGQHERNSYSSEDSRQLRKMSSAALLGVSDIWKTEKHEILVFTLSLNVSITHGRTVNHCTKSLFYKKNISLECMWVETVCFLLHFMVVYLILVDHGIFLGVWLPYYFGDLISIFTFSSGRCSVLLKGTSLLLWFCLVSFFSFFCYLLICDYSYL